MTALRRAAFQAVRLLFSLHAYVRVREGARGNMGATIEQCSAPSPDEFPMQCSREDGFSGSTDPSAHGQRASTPFPVTVMIGVSINFSFLSELV